MLTEIAAIYDTNLQWCKDTLKVVMAQRGLNVAGALLFVKNLKSVKSQEIAGEMFTAAAVEIIKGEKE